MAAQCNPAVTLLLHLGSGPQSHVNPAYGHGALATFGGSWLWQWSPLWEEVTVADTFSMLLQGKVIAVGLFPVLP